LPETVAVLSGDYKLGPRFAAGKTHCLLLPPNARWEGNVEALLSSDYDLAGPESDGRWSGQWAGDVKSVGGSRSDWHANDVIGFAGAAVSKACFDAIGELDDSFNNLDVRMMDYCLRAKRAGVKIGVCHAVKLWTRIHDDSDWPDCGYDKPDEFDRKIFLSFNSARTHRETSCHSKDMQRSF
jgi:hypothetical protein